MTGATAGLDNDVRMGLAEPDLAAFRADAATWITERLAEFRALRGDGTSLPAEVAWNGRLYQELWAAGFSRRGWPAVVGGLNGTVKHRAVLCEELMRAGLASPNMFPFYEAYAPPFVAYASDELIATELVPYLSGERWWSQGFSEPEAGSDLANLKTRAVREGDHYVLNGQKIWTSLAQFSQRCIVLARTGTAESRHRGISAFLVDTDTPGFDVRPIRAMNDTEEFCEVFLDEVRVPVARLIGAENEGWAFTLAVLASERGAAFWARHCWLAHELDELVRDFAVQPRVEAAIGRAYQDLVACRGQSMLTIEAMAAGRVVETSSIDKILMATAEKALFDAAWQGNPKTIALDEGTAGAKLRSDYLYSRASSIYGGSGEIQRSIVAERLLGMPR